MKTFIFIDDSGNHHILTKNLQLYLHTTKGCEMFPRTYYVLSIIGYKDIYVSYEKYNEIKEWLENE